LITSALEINTNVGRLEIGDWISEAAPLKPHVLTTLMPAADMLWNVSEMSFRVDNQYAFDPTNRNSLELIEITDEPRYCLHKGHTFRSRKVHPQADTNFVLLARLTEPLEFLADTKLIKHTQ